ncbi:hypothetical protein ACLOJK_035958 [Asimina triloba]
MVSPAGVFQCSLLWLFSVAGIFSSVSASLVLERKSLKVTSPASLRGEYNSAIGTFGLPRLAESQAGTVVYPNENEKGCLGFRQSYKAKPDALPTFLLLDRGDCYFAIKAWRAQEAGAAAVLVADDSTQELLITHDSLSESAAYIDLDVTIPCAFISKKLGDQLKKAAKGGEIVNANLNWPEAVPEDEEQDDVVDYELWITSNYDCGPKCDGLLSFLKSFKGSAQALEQGGYTRFTPHYVTWYCPPAFVFSRQCKSQCINRGRYCAPDPNQGSSQGYLGKDVVVENLRQLCVFRAANESDMPWVWWDYVTEFQTRCPMEQKKYNKECADNVLRSLGRDKIMVGSGGARTFGEGGGGKFTPAPCGSATDGLDRVKIERCMGEVDVDSDNPVLKEEMDAVYGKGGRGNATIALPTIILNNRQYRGKLETGAVLAAIFSDLWGITKPAARSSKKTASSHFVKGEI